MAKRKRGLSTSALDQTPTTPSRNTRQQTHTIAVAERDHGAVNADLASGSSPPSTRKKTLRGHSVRINTEDIVHSPETLHCTAERSPVETTEGFGNEIRQSPIEEAEAVSSQSLSQVEAVASMSIAQGLYRPPKRPPPADPRRRATPVPGAAPKAALGDRLRRAANEVRDYNFEYRSITADEVRLMKLEKGNTTDPIKVAVATVPFRDLGIDWVFEALSYHWGDEDAAEPLLIRDLSLPLQGIRSIVENHLQRRKMRIKYNLYEALYHLRRPDLDVWLWVDAVCINQSNPSEKEVQVARIADIYVAADSVLVWLGQGSQQTKSAIRLLNDLANTEKLPGILADKGRLSQWKDLAHLMKAEWFSRRWIIQELTLAKNAAVFCGSDEIHWHDLRDGINLYLSHEDQIRTWFHESPDYNHDYHTLEDPEVHPAKILVEKVVDVFCKVERSGTERYSFVATYGLENLVSSLFAFHTSDPRDTINGLLNISKEGLGLGHQMKGAVAARPRSEQQATCILDDVNRSNDSHIAQTSLQNRIPPPLPSYRKDLLDVYVGFLRWIVKSTGRIDILCRHWAIPERKSQISPYQDLVTLPTWIQLTSDGPIKNSGGCWHRQNADDLVGLPDQSPYNACDSLKMADVTFSIHKPSAKRSDVTANIPSRKLASMRVKGLQLGTVDSHSDPMSGGNITMRALRMLGWKRDQSLEDLKDDIWRTLVAERGADGKNPPGLWRKSCLDILTNYTTHDSINIDKIMPNIKLKHTKEFLKRVRQVTWNRTFMKIDLDPIFKQASRSDSPAKGLGPCDTQRGDIVCILYGCSVPCMLRPRSDWNGIGEPKYDFVGETYVYGFMGGEAITMLGKREREQHQKSFTLH